MGIANPADKEKRATSCEMTRSSRTEILVRLAGIEPTTPWFVAKYSIQLSYSRVKRKYSTALLQNGSPFFAMP